MSDKERACVLQVITQRLMKLQSKGNVTSLRAELLVKRRRRSNSSSETWEVVRARGHLDEVQALRAAGSSEFDASQPAEPLVLLEGPVLGGGAFSRVSIVTGVVSSLSCGLHDWRWLSADLQYLIAFMPLPRICHADEATWSIQKGGIG